MTRSIESAVVHKFGEALAFGPTDLKGSSTRPTVLIVGPPWPRSGAAWILRNQIDHYRARGFDAVLVIVPFHRWFMRENSVWDEVKEGFQDLGAKRVFTAPLDSFRYTAAKYRMAISHCFRGTALDWGYAMARSAEVPEELIQFFDSTQTIAFLHVNYVQTLGFAMRLRNKLRMKARVPVIVETHDIQSHLIQERREVNPFTRKQDKVERVLGSEISLLGQANVLVHLSIDDESFFRKRLHTKPHVLVLPTIDEQFISSVKSAIPFTDAIDLLFVGQKHAPNVYALKWFFEEVWPLLWKGQYALKIVGPVDALFGEMFPELFESVRHYFVGQVDDLARFYRSTRCVIAPMVSGSGTSIKTIEALALGKPFVGTSKAFRGMPVDRLQEMGIRYFDTAQEFAAAVVDTLGDEQASGGKSRSAYEEVFSVGANFASRDRVLDAAAAAIG